MVSWRVLIGSFLLASAPVAASVAADDSAGMASYEAVYHLDLWENTPSSAVESVDGKTFYSLTRGCDGWHSTEKYAINFLLSEGQSSEFVSVYDVWESHKGDSFSFNIKEDSSFDGKKSYEGFANLFTGYGEAQFFGDADGSIELPSHTVFPQKHLTTLIKQAEAGSRVYQSHLFIGGEADDSQYFTSTLIGNAKEISMEDVRIGLDKMIDRFSEHPATILVLTNLNYAEAPKLMPRDVLTANAMNWREVKLEGTNAYNYREQLESLHDMFAEGWETQTSKISGNPVFKRPSVVVIYREDHRILLDAVIPRPGIQNWDYDFILASQPWRATTSAKFKAEKIIAPLARSLAPGGRLLAIQSCGKDPAAEL